MVLGRGQTELTGHLIYVMHHLMHRGMSRAWLQWSSSTSKRFSPATAALVAVAAAVAALTLAAALVAAALAAPALALATAALALAAAAPSPPPPSPSPPPPSPPSPMGGTGRKLRRTRYGGDCDGCVLTQYSQVGASSPQPYHTNKCTATTSSVWLHEAFVQPCG